MDVILPPSMPTTNAPAHAEVSGSTVGLLLGCASSLSMIAAVPEALRKEASVYADEGSALHEVVAWLLADPTLTPESFIGKTIEIEDRATVTITAAHLRDCLKRAMRRWVNEATAAAALLAAGFDETDIFALPELRSPAQVEKFGALPENLIVKAASGTTLARNDNARIAVPDRDEPRCVWLGGWRPLIMNDDIRRRREDGRPANGGALAGPRFTPGPEARPDQRQGGGAAAYDQAAGTNDEGQRRVGLRARRRPDRGHLGMGGQPVLDQVRLRVLGGTRSPRQTQTRRDHGADYAAEAGHYGFV